MAARDRNQKFTGNFAEVADILKATKAAEATVNAVIHHSQEGIPDPWLPVARLVLEGVYDRADSSTKESITLGLRTNRHPDAQRAVQRLWPDGVPNKLKL